MLLTIAGFDPSGGAGFTADLNTFRSFGKDALAVCTAVTFQNESQFEGVRWMTSAEIIRQIEILQRKHKITHVKIGLVENLDTLTEILACLVSIGVPKIVWDPILSASAGFKFYDPGMREVTFLKHFELITFNMVEIMSFNPGVDPFESATQLSKETAILLKGGHSQKKYCEDILYYDGEEVERFESKRGPEKHGTGYILSAAITAALYSGCSLIRSCELAKKYISRYINSSDGLLGIHDEKYLPLPVYNHRQD